MRKAVEHPGVYIRSLMKAKQWTGMDLSDITKVSKVHISHILTGKSLISAKLAVKLGAAFNIPPMEFLSRCNSWKLSTLEPRRPRRKYTLCPTCGRPQFAVSAPPAPSPGEAKEA